MDMTGYSWSFQVICEVIVDVIDYYRHACADIIIVHYVRPHFNEGCRLMYCLLYILTFGVYSMNVHSFFDYLFTDRFGNGSVTT